MVPELTGCGPFARSLAIGLASEGFAWSVAVKCAAPHDQLRVRSLHRPHVQQPNEFHRQRDILLWLGATPHSRFYADCDPDALSAGEAARLLDAEESRQLARFLRIEDRMSYLAAHAGARLLLGSIAEQASDRLRFEQSAHGKPVLVDAPAGLDFSLSHTRGAVAIAAAFMPVGVDIEPLRHVTDIDAASEIVLAPEERRTLAMSPSVLRSRLFLRYWTLKEAILKAAGVGFAIPPNTVIVDPGPSPAVLSVPATLGSVAEWHVIAPAI